MAKTIGQQVREKTAERMARQAEDPTLETSPQTKAFIASATYPMTNEDAIQIPGEDAPPPEAAPETATPDVAVESETPPEIPAETDPVEATEAAPEAHIAAPAVAAEPEEEWEDAEWEDDAAGTKYRIKAPRGMAQMVRSGWMRHADYSRQKSRLGRFQDRYQEKIESGYMDKVAPIFDAIDSDPELAQAVAQLYQQRVSNLPLRYVQPGYEPQVQPQQHAAPAYEEDPSLQDPYLQQIMSPLQRQLAEIQTQLSAREQAELQARQQQQAYAQQRAAEEREWQDIHRDLVREYPQEFNGTQADLQKLQQLKQYADQAGYTVQQWGMKGRIFQAKRAIEANTWQRSAAPPSAAAKSVAQAEARSRAAAAAAAKEVANSLVVGTSNAPDPAPPRPLPTRDKDGKPLPVKKAIRNVIQNRLNAR